MARRRKNGADPDPIDGGEDAPVEQSNSAARADTIRQACRQITELEDERKEISAAISEVKSKLVKGDLGMKIADFNIALRLYRLEGEDRDILFDTLRETFDALGVGEQLGFLDALAEQKGKEEAAGLYDATA